jgi:hypothetical protein
MKAALLMGLAAALTFTGTAGARADTIYLTETLPAEAVPAEAVPAEVVPGYSYVAPAPRAVRRSYVVTAPATTVVEEEPAYVVVTPPPAYVAPPPAYVIDDPAVRWVAPPRIYRERGRRIEVRTVAPVTCALDASGFARCD